MTEPEPGAVLEAAHTAIADLAAVLVAAGAALPLVDHRPGSSRNVRWTEPGAMPFLRSAEPGDK